MVLRSRSETVRTIDGKRDIYDASNTSIIATQTTSVTAENRCIDEVIFGDNGMFSVTKQTVLEPLMVNGSTTNPGKEVYTNFCPIGKTLCATPSSLPSVNGDRGNGPYMTDLIKKTNPNRPYIDLPIFIAELKDIPDLIFKLGTPLKTVAKANLTYQFGWKPLISDLGKILDFQSRVIKREKELKRLFKKGLSYTMELDQLSGEYSIDNLWEVPAVGLQLRGRYSATKQTTVRGHVKWFPTSTGPHTSEEMHQLARRAVLGLTVDFATAWELIPFSWLVDWFSNVGDFLIAQRNIVPCEPRDTCIMRDSKVTSVVNWHSVTNVYNLSYQTPRGEWTEKTRTPVGAFLSADLNWLNPTQLSILGSLAVLRNRRLLRL